MQPIWHHIPIQQENIYENPVKWTEKEIFK